MNPGTAALALTVLVIAYALVLCVLALAVWMRGR